MRARDLLIDIEPLRTGADFRAIFVARVVSLFGLGMAAVVLSAQVYGLTEATFQVAVTSMIMSVTVLLGSLWGGWAADRGDRRRLIVRARSCAALAFAGLAVNAFLTLVRPDQLPAAGALISLTGEIGSIAAPLLGGVLLALGGPRAGVRLHGRHHRGDDAAAASRGTAATGPRRGSGRDARRYSRQGRGGRRRFAARRVPVRRAQPCRRRPPGPGWCHRPVQPAGGPVPGVRGHPLRRR